MGHLDLKNISYQLADGRPLLANISFRVGQGRKVGLIGPNGTGKTTLLRMIAGELEPDEGTLNRSGSLAWMPQFIGKSDNNFTVRDLFLLVAEDKFVQANERISKAEDKMILAESDDSPELEDAQMRYANALINWGEVGGYELENEWDKATVAAVGLPFESIQFRRVNTFSGGQQKRLILEYLLRSKFETLILDEPDNYLDVPAKRWLEDQLQQSEQTVLLVSHDRELLATATTDIATLEPGHAGAIGWSFSGNFADYPEARQARNDRLAQDRRRWDEEHQKLKQLVVMYRQKASYNADMASRLQAAVSRLEKFEAVGPPVEVPLKQHVNMRLAGSRTAKRSVIMSELALTDLTEPFSGEFWYGERIGVLGDNGTGKSHFLRLLAAGGTDPDRDSVPVTGAIPQSVAHSGSVKLGSRVRPGWFAQTHDNSQLRGRTLLEILNRGDDYRAGRHQEEAAKVLDRYGLAGASQQIFDSLSGGQQARFQILLLELSGVNLLLLDEPTDNLDLHSAEALEEALDTFNGTVVAVTHDRWFARSLDRFLVFTDSQQVKATDQPHWQD